MKFTDRYFHIFRVAFGRFSCFVIVFMLFSFAICHAKLITSSAEGTNSLECEQNTHFWPSPLKSFYPRGDIQTNVSPGRHSNCETRRETWVVSHPE